MLYEIIKAKKRQQNIFDEKGFFCANSYAFSYPTIRSVKVKREADKKE